MVNAANEDLWMGGGVCGVIFNAAGAEKLTEACRKMGHCDTGHAVITPGFDLADHIIHAVGPVYRDGKSGEPEQLYGCYIGSLDLVRDNGIKSVAFPLISSGIYGYPKEEAWRIALKACDDWIRDNEEYEIQIVFAVIDDHVYDLGKRILDDI